MDFGISEEQELLQETVRGFVTNECPATHLREVFDGESGHDPELWAGMLEMGLGGLTLSEDFGGAGLDILDLALVSEVLGEGAVPSPFFGHTVAGLALAWGGSDEQKASWLPRLASGDVVATAALAEAENRWQPEQWSLETDKGTLTGSKQFVTSADLADLLVVGISGGDLALVERSADGVDVTPVEGLDRTRRVAEVNFDSASCEILPGGNRVANRVRDAALILLAADSLGAAWNLIQMTIDYTGTRQQFGTNLTQFQAVKHQIANMAADIEQTRALCWYAAYAQDQLPDDAPHAAAVAKAHITDRAMEAARDAFELHGGIGFTWECDVQMWFKRCMFNRTVLGTPEIQRERSAALAGW
ncbi:acyl-CoA/acyl-ACP dehydrogenase [Myxococcota bacterium]|nr:acyl-CoA/acyl-ACP dehydrogenase [Myxococcota bacterium]